MPLILVSPYMVKQPSYLFDFVPSSDPMILTMQASSGLIDGMFTQTIRPSSLMINALPNATAGIFVQSQTSIVMAGASLPADGVFMQKSSNIIMSSSTFHDVVFAQRNSALAINAISPR